MNKDVEYNFNIARKVKEFYLREDVQEKMFEIIKNREVVPVFKGRVYGKRPSAMEYYSEFKYFVNKGMTSLHASVERWRNPLELSSNISKKEMDELRIGWDLVIDIDANISWEHGKITALLILEVLKNKYGLENIPVKFSGSRGFHIFIPFESLPKEVNGKMLKDLFPDFLQIMARYIKFLIKDELYERLKDYDYELVDVMEGKDPYRVVEVEEGWSNRHLFRMPYSFNEKTWLVSVPLSFEELERFNLEMAKPENVKDVRSFFMTDIGDAEELLVDADDYDNDIKRRKEFGKVKEVERKKVVYKDIKDKIPKEFFPPCIKNILKGLGEGRKRSLFVLLRFLKISGYDWEEIKDIVNEWNSRNKEPLRQSYVDIQIKHAMKSKTDYLPPNCDNKDYYLDIGVCEKDKVCDKIKNPVSYARRKMFFKKK